MKKLFFVNIISLALLILLGANSVIAEPLTKLSFHSRLSSINNEDYNITNSRATNIAQSDSSLANLADKQPIGWSQRDFATPDSPAGKLIGSSTSKIPNISTPGALATNLLNGLNSDGKFATGIAIDTVPYLLFRGPGITLEEYRKNEELQQFLSNMSISIATNKETSSDAARVGVAAQFTLLNQGDRRIDPDYLEVLNKFATKITGDPELTTGKTPEEVNNIVSEKFKNFKNSKDYTDEINRLEKKPIWTVAVGSSFITPSGRYSDLRGDGTGIWSTYRQGIGGNTQLILHGAYRSGERISDPNGSFFTGDTILVGTRLRMGDDLNSRFSLEAAYNIEIKQRGSSNSYLSFGLGLEQKVVQQENLWLSLSLTADPGRQNGGDFRFNS